MHADWSTMIELYTPTRLSFSSEGRMTEREEPASNDLFGAISHPLRIRILRALAKRPMHFAELKRRFKIKSSGGLDFHLTKLGGLIVTNKEGSYSVTRQGIRALMAINTVRGCHSWQRKAHYISLATLLIAGGFLAFANNVTLLFIVFLGTILWMSYLPS